MVLEIITFVSVFTQPVHIFYYEKPAIAEFVAPVTISQPISFRLERAWKEFQASQSIYSSA
ncbi:MAG: hypothetical protein KKH94_07345 [Candidatus Omnitrophica bacterium]|nr:hypothetical protein [Candidatus Omnitrophota bacterium]